MMAEAENETDTVSCDARVVDEHFCGRGEGWKVWQRNKGGAGR